MYTAFYDLGEKPFSLTPDPRYLFLAVSHREALAHVLYGIDQGEGFIVVTGEVGTGKTTLCRALLQRLGAGTEVAYIFNPVLTGDELLRAVNAEFSLPTDGCTRHQLNDQLNQFLLRMKKAGRHVLLIIDEAQNLSRGTLEQVRLLSNLETATSKLVQILLFGQPELDDMLDSNEMRQLRQRIGVRSGLGPMTATETREYVRHRLRIARGGDCDLFSESALREVHRRTRGVPRLVNLLCDRSLLTGYATSSRLIESKTVNQAFREIFGVHRRSRWRRAFFRSLPAAVVLVAALGAVAWNQSAARLPWPVSSEAAAEAVPRSPDPVEARRESE